MSLWKIARDSGLSNFYYFTIIDYLKQTDFQMSKFLSIHFNIGAYFSNYYNTKRGGIIYQKRSI